MSTAHPPTGLADTSVSDWLKELFLANVDAVFNVAYRVLWNHADAEDVVQHAFIKALSRIDQLRNQGRIRPWLLQIAYREALGTLRKRRDVPVDPQDLPEIVSAQRGPADHVVASQIAVVVNELLEQMNPDERLAVILRDVEGLAMHDVAEVLGIGVSAAKMRVHRGRSSLRVLVNAAGVR